MSKFKSILLNHRRGGIVAVVPIHEADAVMFLGRLLPNLAELGWGVVWHFDKVSHDSRERMLGFSGTIGFTEEVDGEEFRDIHRQAAWDVAASSGAAWIVPHDADETWEEGTKERLETELKNQHRIVKAMWYNVWDFDTDGTPLIRVDPKFIRVRPRFYPTSRYRYQYKRNAAVPYCTSKKGPVAEQTDMRILHWGLSTPELRERHLRRWEGKIKDGFWKMSVDPSIPVTLKRFDSSVPHTEWLRQ